MDASLSKRLAPYAAWLGALGLLAAAALYLYYQQLHRYVQAALALGLVLLAVAVLLNPSAVQALAGRRQTRYGANVAVMVLALLGVLGLVNYLAVQNPRRWDLTEEQRNTLAPETVDLLAKVEAPVHALAFSPPNDSSRPQVEQLLENYRTASQGRFTYEFLNPYTSNELVNRYQVTSANAIVLVSGDRSENVTFAAESEVSKALLRLSAAEARVLYALTGHNEISSADTTERGLSALAGVLADQKYELRPLNLVVSGTVPADATAVIVAGPLTPLTADEVGALGTYLDEGGALVAMLDPTGQALAPEAQVPLTTTNPLVDYLSAAWGITVNDDLVVDRQNSVPQTDGLFPLGFEYGSSPVTQGLEQLFTVFPYARSLSVPEAGSGPANITHTPLVTLHPEAWGETDWQNFSAASPMDAADTQPPLHAVVAAENTATQGRVVVVGDADFATNYAFQVFQATGNALLFSQAVNWAGQAEELLALSPRIPTQRTLVITNEVTFNLLRAVALLGLPLLALAAGVSVWLQRRQHA